MRLGAFSNFTRYRYFPSSRRIKSHIVHLVSEQVLVWFKINVKKYKNLLIFTEFNWILFSKLSLTMENVYGNFQINILSK